VDLAVRAESAGALAELLDITVHEGTGGSFEDCTGFDATAPLFDGTLEEMTAAGWISLGPIFNSGDSRTFRVRVEVQDVEDALGRTARAEFVWEATPS
jgi:hypothetical protein